MNQALLTRISGIAGIAGIALIFLANVLLGNTPNADDPPQKVVRYLADNRNSALASGALFLVAYVMLLTFSATLRRILRSAGDTSGLPDLFFGANLWILGVGTATQVAAAAAAFRAPALDPVVAQTLLDLTNIGFVLIGVPFAAMLAAASVSSLSSRALPTWIGWVGIVAAIINLAKLVTLFPREGGLAPGGALSLVAVIPIWVWSISVAVIMIRGIRQATDSAGRVSARPQI